MGYSACADAFDTIRTFKGTRKISNVWDHKGNTYFYEIGKENRDGAITGSIYKYLQPYDESETYRTVKRIGSFRIEPNGEIGRAPYGLKERLIEPKIEKMSYHSWGCVDAYCELCRPRGIRR